MEKKWKEKKRKEKKKDMQAHTERWRCISLLSVVQEVTRPDSLFTQHGSWADPP